MGLHSRNGNGHGTVTIFPPPRRTIASRGLALRKLTKVQRACLAADVIDGLTALVPSQKLVHAAFGVSQPYVDTMRKLSPENRAAILAGEDTTSFVDLVVKPPRQFCQAMPEIPDITLMNIARAVGVERMLDAAAAVENHT
jgi:hypothetical protein